LFWRNVILIFILSFINPTHALVIKTAFHNVSPLFIVDKNKKITSGLVHELISEIDKNLGPDITIEYKPSQSIGAKRMKSLLKAGKIDMIFGMTKNKKKMSQFRFMDDIFLERNFVFVAKNNDDINFLNYEDLRNMQNKESILVNDSTGAHTRLKNIGGLSLETVTAFSHTQLLNMLVFGRARLLFSVDLYIINAAKKLGIMSKIKIIPFGKIKSNQHLVFRKDISDDVFYKVQKAFRELKKTSKYQNLLITYGFTL
jgi:ABC-type amino acid transport substrate-binding protein